MLYPSIDKLLNHVESKYSLVVSTAKRARLIKEGAQILIDNPKSHKFVGIALEEFYEEKYFIVKK